MASVLMQWTWEPIHLGKPRETLIGHDVSVTAMNMRSNPYLGKPRQILIGHDVSVTAMNMRSNPSWVNHVKL